jgi:ABC-type transport system substrate-binding protein
MFKHTKSVSVLILTLVIAGAVTPVLLMPHAQYEATPSFFFTLTLYCPQGNKVREQVAPVLKAELAKIGINVNVQYMDFATLLNQMDSGGATGATAANGGFDMFLMGDGPDTIDPSGLTSWFDSKYVAPTGNNVWRFFDPRLDSMLEQADAMWGSEQDIVPIYQQVLHMVKDEAFSIELYYPTQYCAKQKSVQNATLWADYALYDARFWTLAGKTAGADDTSVIYALPTDINNIIETLSEVTYDTQIQHLMFDALIMDPYTQIDQKYQRFMPALAQSWESTNNNLTYTFHLRTDVKWQDGVPFTSKDVKFTYDAIMDPDTAAADSMYWRDNVASVSTPDNYTVVVQMQKPMHAAFELLFRRMIMPEHILGSTPHSEWSTSPYNTGQEILPGTGPYQLVKWNQGESFEFVANPNYFMGEPFIKHFYVRIIPDTAVGLAALQNNEVQVVGTNYGVATSYDTIKNDPNLDTYVPAPRYGQQLHLNAQNPYLSNVLVRQAISYAIPREHICTDLALGQAMPATQWVAPAGCLAYDPTLTVTPYDIGQARALMEQAGYKFAYLEPQTTPISAYYVPAGGAFVVGLIIGAAVVFFVNRGKRQQS